MHPDVVRAWCRTVDAERIFSPYFLHAESDRGQRVLQLLVGPKPGWRMGAIRPLNPAGLSLFDYQDPLLAATGRDGTLVADDFWPSLERELGQRAGTWFDICTFHRLRKELGGMRVPGSVPKSVSFLDLAAYGDFDAYVASRSSRKAKLLRRKSKLYASGDVQFRVHTAEDLDTVLAWLPDLEAERDLRYPESSLPEGYLHNLVAGGIGSGVVHCSSLSLDGRAISWHVGFDLNGTFYWYVPAFRSEHGALSPGTLHLCRAIEWAFAQSNHTFDFLLGDDSYKTDWTDGEAFEVSALEIRSRAFGTLSRRQAARGLGIVRRVARRAGSWNSAG